MASQVGDLLENRCVMWVIEKEPGNKEALRAQVADSCHLAGRGLSDHGLVGRGQVSWVQCPRAVDGHPINGTEGRMGKVQVQASVRKKTVEFDPNLYTIIIKKIVLVKTTTTMS